MSPSHDAGLDAVLGEVLRDGVDVVGNQLVAVLLGIHELIEEADDSKTVYFIVVVSDKADSHKHDWNSPAWLENLYEDIIIEQRTGEVVESTDYEIQVNLVDAIAILRVSTVRETFSVTLPPLGLMSDSFHNLVLLAVSVTVDTPVELEDWNTGAVLTNISEAYDESFATIKVEMDKIRAEDDAAEDDAKKEIVAKIDTIARP